MKYTEDQEYALENCLKWFKGPVTKTVGGLTYLVDGAAGTGKTTVVKQIIKILGLRNSQLAVTAPTHQAKKVIQEATDFTAITTQKLLGLRPNVNLDDFDISNPQFDPLSEEQIKYFKVVIIDESSMVNKDAFDLLIEKAKIYGVRIIFLGDSYQLPPVNEKMSKVFTSVPNVSTLRTVIRQGNDNPNTEFLLGLRDDIDLNASTNLNKFMLQGDKLIESKGYKFQINTDFGRDLLTFLHSTPYEHDMNHIRYLAWTNKSVMNWCEALRRQIIENPNQQLAVGERLIGYSTIQDFRSKDILLQNSDVYTIEKIEEEESNYGVKGYFTTIINSEGERFLHFIVNKNDKDKFVELAYERWIAARRASFKERGKKWSQFFSFKDRHLVMEDVFYKGMPIKKDLYYAYGSTVHKSQGSTFGNTAINLKDIGRNRTVSERLRLMYVALSRCKDINLILSK